MNDNEGQEENENSRRGNKCSVLSFKKQKKNWALYSAMKAETK